MATRKNSVHDYDTQYERVLKRLSESALSAENKKLIQSFERTCHLDGLGKPRRINIVGKLIVFCRDYLKKDLDKASKEDLKNSLLKIENRPDISPLD